MEINEIGPFLAYFERIRSRTMRVASLIPPDKIEWRMHLAKACENRRTVHDSGEMEFGVPLALRDAGQFHGGASYIECPRHMQPARQDTRSSRAANRVD